MPYGYWGKILRVDLSRGEISVEEHDELWYRTYMGGACVGAFYLLQEMPAGVEPLSAENMIVFAPSVVTGTPASGFSRHAVISKSPLTGLISDSQAGGFWGPELKAAGYDAIVVVGRAEKPVYLWVHDGQAEIRDAAQLWGKDTGEAQAALREELGDQRVRALLIGPGGENLVRYANILNELRDANGRGGLGAVMGSKNLKAIAVRGHQRIPMQDEETVKRQVKDFVAHFMDNPSNRGLNVFGTAEYVDFSNTDGQLPTRNFQTGQFEGADAISGETMKETVLVDTEACWACAVKCKRVVKIEAPYTVDPAYGGPEFETVASLGSCCGVADMAAVCKGNELCNRYGLDTISTGVSIAFGMECYEAGLLTSADTGGIDLRFGNAPALVQVIELIAKREGIGALLGEGVKRAAERIGKGSARFAMHTKGLELPMHEPRAKGMLGISYAVSPIGADHVVVEHDTDFDFQAPQVFIDQMKSLGLLERLPTESVDSRKVRMFYYLQNHFSFMDALCLCVLCFAPVRTFTMADMVDIISAVTGWETSLWEIMKLGERRINMFRAFNVREGFRAADDTLPERMFEPLRTGPRAGYKVSAEDFRAALDFYYEMMNWDEQGIPRPAKLAELDLGWVNVLLAPERRKPC
jgi:aldehyde:ferredoxin oxidoreductase